MKILGLTGGIGMGKSTVANVLASLGAAICDTDQLAREIVQPGQPALREIRDQFGPQFLQSDGQLDRDALGALVFADSLARQKLEAITHPRIRALWQHQVQLWSHLNLPCAVVVIPLLLETGSQSDFNAVLCVACTARTQHQRLHDRGWTDTQIRQRLAAQLPIADKMAHADFVIWNDGPLELIQAQIERIFKALSIDA
jgi:dephospho-CoA kinase